MAFVELRRTARRAFFVCAPKIKGRRRLAPSKGARSRDVDQILHCVAPFLRNVWRNPVAEALPTLASTLLHHRYLCHGSGCDANCWMSAPLPITYSIRAGHRQMSQSLLRLGRRSFPVPQRHRFDTQVPWYWLTKHDSPPATSGRSAQGRAYRL